MAKYKTKIRRAEEEELRRKRARRSAEFLASQAAARSSRHTNHIPAPPPRPSVVAAIERAPLEVQRVFKAANYDIMSIHRSHGNRFVKRAIMGQDEARVSELRGGWAMHRMISERHDTGLGEDFLAREKASLAEADRIEARIEAKAAARFPAEARAKADSLRRNAAARRRSWQEFGIEPDLSFVAQEEHALRLADGLDSQAAEASSQFASGASAGTEADSFTVRDPQAGLDVTYDASGGGAPEVNLTQVKEQMGSGHPLDQNTQRYMEWRFGVDFSKVRLHTGPKADALSKALFAHAFALGADVAFQGDSYRPGTKAGDRLLAHELTHVVQAGMAPRVAVDEAPQQAATGVTLSSALLPGASDFAPLPPSVTSITRIGESLRGIAKSGSVSEPTDAIEVEADRMADEVVSVSRGDFQAAMRDLVPGAEQEEDETKKAGRQQASELVKRALAGGGQALPEALRARLEEVLGSELGEVRVHVDESAAEAAQALSARAFTMGTDIVFGSGEYQPGTPGGDELIAHEITHVAQHLQGRAGQATGHEGDVPVTTAGDAVEREAEQVAGEFAGGAKEQEASARVSGAENQSFGDEQQATAPAIMGIDTESANNALMTAGEATAARTITRDTGDKIQAKESTDQPKAADRSAGGEADIVEMAQSGFAGGGGKLPHLDRIQEAFGSHDVGDIKATVGGAAKEAAEAIGAVAYASGDKVAFKGSPDLHTAAHEAAHVVQQRSGVSVEGGVGNAGDRYEQHADAVADAVVAGKSAESLLDPFAGGTPAVQQKAVQRKEKADEGKELSPEEEAEKKKLEDALGSVSTKAGSADNASNSTAEPPTENVEVKADEEGSAGDSSALEGVTASLATPTSGGSTGPITAGGSAPSLRAPDQLVDYYMETHWDSSEFMSKCQDLGVTPPGFGSEADKWGAVSLSPGARSALNLSLGIGGGVVDAVVIGGIKAIPGVGVIAHVATGVKDIWSATEKYGEKGVDDGWGMAIQITRSVVDIVGSVAGNLSDLCTVVGDALVGTVVLAPAGGVVLGIGVALDGVGLPCDVIKAVLDAVSLVRNIVKANDAENSGQFEKAGKYRSLAAGDALNLIVDGIALAASVASTASAGTLPGEMGEDAAEAVKEASKGLGDKVFAGAIGLGKSGGDTASKQINRWGGPAEGIAATSKSWNNIKAAIGLGDAMKQSPNGLLGGHFIEPSTLKNNTPLVQGMAVARQKTIEEFSAAWTDLEGSNPKYYQKLINDILAPPGTSGLDTYSALISPSSWIKHLLQGMRVGGQGLNDLTSGGAASVLRITATGLQALVQPAVDMINSFSTTYKPALDEMLLNFADAVRNQQVSLQFARNSITSVDSFLGSIGTFADSGGGLDKALDSIIASAAGLRLDPASVEIPWYLPDWVVLEAVEAFNSMVASITAKLQSVKDKAMTSVDGFVDEQVAWGQAQLAKIQEVIKEGGQAEQMLQSGYDTFAAGIATLAEAIAQWDATIAPDIPAAVAWLTEKADAMEASTFEARIKEFQSFMAGDAQGKVDSWRGDHSESVEQAYYPTVPAHEVAAFEEAASDVKDQLDEYAVLVEKDEKSVKVWQKHQIQWNRAVAAANAARGAKGQGAVEDFWAAADDLAEVASAMSK